MRELFQPLLNLLNFTHQFIHTIVFSRLLGICAAKLRGGQLAQQVNNIIWRMVLLSTVGKLIFIYRKTNAFDISLNFG